MLQAIKWLFTSSLVVTVFSTLINLIMMKWIDPQAYGLVAMVIPISACIQIFTNFGYNKSIVSKKVISNSEINAVLTFSILICMGFCFLLYLNCSSISKFYNQPQLKVITLFFIPIIFMTAINTVLSGVIFHRKKFKLFGSIEIAAILFSGILGLVLAYKGYGVYSLLLKDILSCLIILISSFIGLKYIPVLNFSLSNFKYHFKFGSYYSLSNVVSFFSRNLDDILIGKGFGSSALGLYTKGYALLKLPLSLVSKSVTQALLPYVSERKEDVSYVANIYNRSFLGLFVINGWLCILIYVSADFLVLNILGYVWEGIIPFIKVFSVLSLFQGVGPLNGLVYEGLNRTKNMLFNTTVVQAINIVSIIIGYIYGTEAIDIAYAYAMGNMIVFALNQLFINKEILHIRRSVLLPCLYIFLMVTAILIFYEFWFGGFISNIFWYISLIATITIVYSGIVYKLLVQIWENLPEELKGLLSNRE